MNKREEMLEGAYPVGFWKYWLLPMWHSIRYAFNTDKWLLQLTDRTEVVKDGKTIKTIKFQRYLKPVGAPKKGKL